MPSDKRTISIPFAKGVDTKTDPNQLEPGSFVLLRNTTASGGNDLRKRYGNSALVPVFSSSGVAIAAFKNELITLDNKTLSSYNPATPANIAKGGFVPCDLSVSTVVRDRNQQAQVDSAYSVVGNLYLYTYLDSSRGSSYVVIDGNTGQQILTGSLSATLIKPRAFAVGNYLVVVAVDTSSTPFSLTIFPILVTSVAVGAPIAVSQTLNMAFPNFDGASAAGNLYLAWNGSDGAVHSAFYNASLTLQAQTSQASETAGGCLSVFADTTRSPLSLWTVYYDGGSVVRYCVQSGTNLGIVLAPATLLSGTTNIVNIIGYAMGGAGRFYYQQKNLYPYTINTRPVRSDYINQLSATETGVIGSTGLFIRGLALTSKAALFNAEPYFVTSYGPANVVATTANQGFEPTYFLLSGATSGTRAQVVSRFASGNAGGYSSSSLLTSLNSIGASQYQFGYLIKDLVASQSPAWNISGGVYFQVPAAPLYSQIGINAGFVDLYNPSAVSTVDMGNNLNINGGCLWAYDGQNVTEQNFHLYPEDILATSASSAGGLGAGFYQWVSVYTWTDNQGNVFRSSPSIPTSMDIGAACQVQLDIPTLRVTNKKNVSIEIYRNTPSIAPNIFTALTVPQSPLMSSTAIDSVRFTDFVTDASLTGNSLLYTTGDVVENTGGPAFAFIGRYKTRFMGISAENRNLLLYSKEVLQGTPVELSELFSLYVNPSRGELTCGIEMDDKFILWTANAISYLAGQGPTNSGAQNDFTEPTFIVSPVGCISPNSLAIIPEGVMFDSGDGIWLLDRNLNVSYIGGDVEAFNGYRVTSATRVPKTTEVRFGLEGSSIVLVYDYYWKRWGLYDGYRVRSATIFNGLYTWLSADAAAFLNQETPDLYSDNGKPILQGITTGFLNLAGLQGFQRAYRLYFMGQYLSPHILNVSIAYDFDSNFVQTASFQLPGTPKYGGDPLYGASKQYGGRPKLEQFRINLKRQKCQSLQVTIEEAMDTSNYVLGPALTLEAINLVVNPKLGYPKLPATKSVK